MVIRAMLMFFFHEIIQLVSITFSFPLKEIALSFFKKNLFCLKLKLHARRKKKVKFSQNSTKDSRHLRFIEYPSVYVYVCIFHIM